MSMCPFMSGHRFNMSPMMRPSQIFDQHFGLTLEPEDFLQPSRIFNFPFDYMRPWRSLASQDDVGSTMHFDKNKFQVSLDVQQFKPDEISVKLTGANMITIEGKHEEKEDQHGFISRHFVRRYVLPKNCDLNRLESKLSSDGILTIMAPKTNAESGLEQKEIKVLQTGEPIKKIEKMDKSEKIENIEKKEE